MEVPYPSLCKSEIIFYGIIWVGSTFYSMYCVYLAGQLFDYSIIGDDFSVSWLGYRKDVSDYEWRIWLPFIIYLLSPWILAHIIFSEVARWFFPQGVPGVSCMITCLFLSIHFSPMCAVFALINVFVYYLILKLKSVTLVWILGIPFLLLCCHALETFWVVGGLSEELFTMMVVSITWVHLRCVSFSLDHLASTQTPNLYNLLGYSFYFPTYFLGPFILYSNFYPNLYRPFKYWSGKRVGTFLFNMLRYLFWAAVTEASLHFLYIHALQYQMESVIGLGEWTLYGLGFLLGQFFCMKYITVYGLARTVAVFEGYDAPPPPKCVSRVHLYTDMWRQFDVGYYQFMHKYIYTPLCAGQRSMTRRLVASAVCFGYVFLWHGIYLTIFIWAALNYLGVTVVSFATHLSKSPFYANWEKRSLSEANSRRLKALLCAPMFIMGPTSSFYFFSDMATGNTYVKHLLFKGSWKGLIILLAVSYCMCQVSMETKNWEGKKSQKLKQKFV